jgi:hypothetical protein
MKPIQYVVTLPPLVKKEILHSRLQINYTVELQQPYSAAVVGCVGVGDTPEEAINNLEAELAKREGEQP